MPLNYGLRNPYEKSEEVKLTLGCSWLVKDSVSAVSTSDRFSSLDLVLGVALCVT